MGATGSASTTLFAAGTNYVGYQITDSRGGFRHDHHGRGPRGAHGHPVEGGHVERGESDFSVILTYPGTTLPVMVTATKTCRACGHASPCTSPTSTAT